MLPASFHLPAWMWLRGPSHGLVLHYMYLVQKKKKGIKKEKVSKVGHERQEWAGTKWDEEAEVGTRLWGAGDVLLERQRGEPTRQARRHRNGRWSLQQQFEWTCARKDLICQGWREGCGGETWDDVTFSFVDGGARLYLSYGMKEESGRLQHIQEVIEGCPVASVMHKVRLDNHSGTFWV